LEVVNGTEVLGVPICVCTGNTPQSQHLLKVQPKLATLLGKVGELPDTHYALAMMRMCLGPSQIKDVVRTQSEAFTRLLGGNLSDSGWQQASLLLSEGGCGLSSVASLAPVAWLAGILEFMAQMESMLEWRP